ncbi:MAG: tRNA 2-thiouridine(34) synthase MnmA, partial [Acidobacteriota bacterium]|nr:tRNA 2-thiouridine(34) synthase MnmA [Acidobacteriota bacterium]
MSGGLDSSVTAWLLSRGERPVVGLSMLLWDRSKEERNGRCCGALDLGDAKRVAQQCGIRHYTLHLEEEFRRQVVDPFVDDYLAGRTPVPCTRCNTFIKFDLFLERARALGCDRIATGHYARIVEGPGGYELHRALQEDKDQSYYLFELTQDQLASSEFPLGERDKREVRELARGVGLVVAEKRESMELCFVEGGIRDFVEEQAAERDLALASEDPGATRSIGRASRIVDRDGGLLGRGEPYYRYTVGQRRALGGGAPEKLYVLGVRPAVNEVVVGPRRELASKGLGGERLHWIGEEPTGDLTATVKIRSRHAGVESRIRSVGKGRVEIEFATPQEAVTPGQAAVFYEGTRVLGGCWIGSA